MHVVSAQNVFPWSLCHGACCWGTKCAFRLFQEGYYFWINYYIHAFITFPFCLFFLLLISTERVVVILISCWLYWLLLHAAWYQIWTSMPWAGYYLFYFFTIILELFSFRILIWYAALLGTQGSRNPINLLWPFLNDLYILTVSYMTNWNVVFVRGKNVCRSVWYASKCMVRAQNVASVMFTIMRCVHQGLDIAWRYFKSFVYLFVLFSYLFILW